MMKDAAKARAVLFDKDGTLFDFQQSWAQFGATVIDGLAKGDEALAERLADAAGFDRQAVVYRVDSPVAAGSAREILTVWAPLLPEWRPLELAAWLVEEARMHSEKGMTPATQDLPELLTRLKASELALGVATHDATDATHTQLEQAGVLDFFDFVAGVDSGYAEKPDPAMMNAFCAKTGRSADTVVMVGDSVGDLLMGRTAGALATIGVLTGPAPHDLLAPYADLMLDDIGALPAALGL